MKKLPSRKPRFQFTEEQMAVAFERLLRHGLPGLGSFWRVFREVDCHRGRPDFVAVEKKQKFVDSGHSLGFVASTVLALLQPKARRSLEFLVAKSNFTPASVRSAIAQLLHLGHAKKCRNATYRLASSRRLSEVDVWAFELKLDKAKRAIFQAQQYRLFAQRVLIVVPPRQIKNYAKHLKTMARWGIGLASFDAATGDFEVTTPPKWGEPVSKEQQIYALGRLIDSRYTRPVRRTRRPATRLKADSARTARRPKRPSPSSRLRGRGFR